MLTSYFVKCPHVGCGWMGSLIPTAGEPSSLSPGSVISFRCPGCQEEWPARIVGEDVRPMLAANAGDESRPGRSAGVKQLVGW